MNTKQQTAEVWRKRIAAQRASGTSIRAWCRDHDVHEHGYYWWRTRLGLSTAVASDAGGRHPRPLCGLTFL